MSHDGSIEESGGAAESPKTPIASRATSVARTLTESVFFGDVGIAEVDATTGTEGWAGAAVAGEACWITGAGIAWRGVAGTGAWAAVEGCAHAAAMAAAAIVRIGNFATTALREIDRVGAQPICETRALAHGDMISKNSVGRVQHGHGRTASRIGLGKVAPDEPIVLSIFANRDGNEHQIRVERANVLYTEQLELQHALREFVESAERRFGGDAEVPERTRLPEGSPGEERAVPLQGDLSSTLARRRARKAEIGELDSFASEIDRRLRVCA
jgi:hypothetical protein